MTIEKLCPERDEYVYDVLVRSGYEGVPSKEEALEEIRKAECFIINGGDGVLIVHSIGESGGHIDVAILPDKRKAWATKGLIKNMLDEAFKQTSKKPLIAYTENARRASKLLRYGFKQSNTEVCEYILTYEEFLKRGKPI